MYGSIHNDPVVRFYDDSFAAGSPLDIDWYTKKSLQFGSSVLDLACGTGRLSIHLARKGLQVTAIDESDGMLEVFRRKLSREPRDVQSRIRIIHGSMHDFSLEQQFETVICCDAFFHNLTPEDERSCLEAIHRHLVPEGRFLFNIHNNPNPYFLGWLTTPEAATPHKRGEYVLPGTLDNLVITEALHHDAANQTITTRLHFEVKAPNGIVKEQADSEWTSRYVCRYEMIYLLELCGFSVESLYGGYHEEPISHESQLVFVVRKSRQNDR